MPPVLFTAATLTALSGRTVTDAQAAVIHAQVLTLVEGEIGAVPDPVPAGVVGAAVELGVAAVPAPGGAASTTLGSFSATYTTGTAGAALTREQRHRLRRAVGKGRPFSIDTISSGPC